MNKIWIVLAISVACLLGSAVACFRVGEAEIPTVAPCVPLEGSEVDPCARDPHWSFRTDVSTSFRIENMPRIPYSILGEIRRLSNIDHSHGLYSPQFYVRGTFIPGSSRCMPELAYIRVRNDGSLMAHNLVADPGDYLTLRCYVDLKVLEYLNGDGPGRVPIVLFTRFVAPENEAKVAEGYSSVIERQLGGREMVVSLSRPNNIADGAWALVGFLNLWDVQRRQDGEVVVVGGWASLDERFDYEFPLGDFIAEVKSAMATIVEENGGRVGEGLGERPYAEDANLRSLLEHLRLYGAYSVADITPVSAPRVPGDTDPDPYGLLVSDAAETAVAEIPGGLEGTATPVSALGDEPTATATVEPTATEEAEPTATATVEPTATPQAAPTPEPENTPTPDAEVAPTATPEAAPTPEPGLTDTPTPEPEPTATDTPEPVIEPTATATLEPAIEPTATPEDAVATDTPEPEVPAPEGPGEVGGEGPGEGGPDGSDTGTGPDG